MVRDSSSATDRRVGATRYTLEGRTSDGRISASGAGNFFHWAQPAPPALVQADFSGSEIAWSPLFTSSLYLENVSAAALGRMIHPLTLVPVSGTLTGRIKLALSEQSVDCLRFPFVTSRFNLVPFSRTLPSSTAITAPFS